MIPKVSIYYFPYTFKFTLDDLYFCYKQGMPDGQTFLAVMKDRLDVMGKLVGTEYSKDTYRKFKDVYNHTINFR